MFDSMQKYSPSIDVQPCCPTRHDTDTVRHDTVRHERLAVSCCPGCTTRKREEQSNLKIKDLKITKVTAK
jgi:hypothetical protein